MTKHIAFLGLGVMGAPMTANLVKQGFEITGWNRTPETSGVNLAREAGVNIVSSLPQAVKSADLIFTCVGDVPDAEEVILGKQGIISWGKPGALVVDMSTIGPNAAQHLAAELNQKNFRFLDAPISGGDVGARQGTLTIMVGGDPEDFEECRPYFEAMGKAIHLCGPVGSGQGVKMCNQILCSLHIVGLCEALSLAQIQGLDPNLIVKVCSTGAAGSWALDNLGPRINQGDLEPGFMIKHILKDLRLVIESNQDSQLPLPGVELATRLFKIVQALDEGKGAEQGTQAMIRAYDNLK